jgi:hypothetical protein
MGIRRYTLKIKMGKQCEEEMNTSYASKLSIV